MRALILLCINHHTTIGVLSFSYSKDMIGAKQNFKNGSRDPWVTWPWSLALGGTLSSQG